jgi:heat shock 70kDa protein 1/2/6/8
MVDAPIPNGSAEAPIEISFLPSVVGINFGNSYASIAVLSKVSVIICTKILRGFDLSL